MTEVVAPSPFHKCENMVCPDTPGTKFKDTESAAGGCTITLDYAYPVRYQPVRLVPNTLRYIAASVIYNCVMYGGGVGGFATQGFIAVIEYFAYPGRNLSEPLRKTSDNAM